MKNILEIRNLSVNYETIDGLIKANECVDLSIKKGSTLGLVGETGAGKTTLAKSILRLIQSPPGKIISGEIYLDGISDNILLVDKQSLLKIRGKQISMIFQDPMTSLNPVMTVGSQISEVICQHEKVSKKESFKEACKMLEMVGIQGGRGNDFPFQFSGGMKQRVVIAIALACKPKLLIADEPTTALDVTIQAQLLELIKNLQSKSGTSMLLITHDLGVVAQNCDFVAIMYAGQIVEYGTLQDIFKSPCHPYTKGLFDALPKLNEQVDRLKPIFGQMPDPTNLPHHCHFAERCPDSFVDCLNQPIQMYSTCSQDHIVRCIKYKSK